MSLLQMMSNFRWISLAMISILNLPQYRFHRNKTTKPNMKAHHKEQPKILALFQLRILETSDQSQKKAVYIRSLKVAHYQAQAGAIGVQHREENLNRKQSFRYLSLAIKMIMSKANLVINQTTRNLTKSWPKLWSPRVALSLMFKLLFSASTVRVELPLSPAALRKCELTKRANWFEVNSW